MPGDENENDPAGDQKPKEPRHENNQQKEILVNEDRLFVPLHFHVHHNGHRCECDQTEYIQQITRKTAIRPCHYHVDREKNRHQSVERYRQFHVIEISPSLDSMNSNEYHSEHIEDNPMVDGTHSAFK